MDPVLEQVMKQCHDRGREVSPSLAHFMVKATEDNCGGESSPKTARSLARIVSQAVERASAIDSPSLETTKMQVAFSEAVAKSEENRALRAKARREEKDAFLQAVLAQRSLSPSALDSLFANIVSFLIVKAAIPSDDPSVSGDGVSSRSARREVSAIAEKVIPQRSLPELVLASPQDKLARISEAADIVTGARLLNAEKAAAANGAAGQSAVARGVERLVEDCADFGSRIGFAVSHLEPLIAQYTAVLRYAVSNAGVPKCQPKAGVARLVSELTHRWQELLLLRELLGDARELRPRVSDLSLLFRQHVSDLSAATGSSPMAALQHDFYPMLSTLSRIRKQLLIERRSLDDRMIALTAIEPYLLTPLPGKGQPSANGGTTPQQLSSRSSRPSFELSLRQDEIDAAVAAMAAMPTEVPSSTLKPPQGCEVTFVPPEELSRLSEGASSSGATVLPGPGSIALRGFCPWTLVECSAMVTEGIASVGAALYHDRLYAFSSHSALRAFCGDPEKYVRGAVAVAAEKPEYVFLLGLFSQFPGLFSATATTFSKEAKANLTHADASVQTSDHPVEQHVDKEYSWNEWDLRRRAIQLLDLQNKRTKSTQTDLSCFRRNGDTQFWQPKSVGTQTGVDEATSTPTVKHYLSGLRGGTERNPTTVVATWDLTEGQRLNFVQRDQRKKPT